MSSTILDFIKLNEKIDYSFLIPLAVLYVVGFWVLVSVWVYIDSKKRIERKRNRVLIFICNLIFGIPFFLLYLLARPYDREEQNEINDAINVPLVNFTGSEGILMSLELKISPSLVAGGTNGNFDAKMKVEVETSDKYKTEEKIEARNEPVVIPMSKPQKGNMINFFKGLIKSKEEKTNNENTIEKVIDIEISENNNKPLGKSNKKKNKKKKHQ